MDISNKLKEILGEYSQGKEITDTTDLRTLGIDSIDLANVLFEIEEQFGVQFEDSEMTKIVSFSDLVSTVESKQK